MKQPAADYDKGLRINNFDDTIALPIRSNYSSALWNYKLFRRFNDISDT